MTPYDIAIKVAQRFLYGYLHHSELSNFFGLMGIDLWENSQDKNAFGDAKKRKEMDEYIVRNLKKYPNYPVPTATSVSAEFKTATLDSIKSNEKAWIKKGFEELIKYEKETIQLFEQLLKQPTEPKDEKLTQKINQYYEDVKKELQKIESVNSQLQKYEYDFDKFVKEYNKGDNNMPRNDDRKRFENEMRRRGLENERNKINMELRRMDEEARYENENDRNYPSMGFTDRFYPYVPFFENDMHYPDREQEQRERERKEYEYMEMMRKGVPGTGPRR